MVRLGKWETDSNPTDSEKFSERFLIEMMIEKKKKKLESNLLGI